MRDFKKKRMDSDPWSKDQIGKAVGSLKIWKK